MTVSSGIAVNTGQDLTLTNTNLTAYMTGNGGTVTLDGASFDVTGGSSPNQTFVFDAPTGGATNTMTVATYYKIPTISNLGIGDIINFGGDTLKLVLNSNGTSYSLEAGTTVISANVTLAAGTTPADFTNSNGNFEYACFYAGTRLATEHGEIAVEDVTAGTMVKTADGKILPVRWVGWSEISLRFADPLRALPIRIQAGALADGVPSRDLLISPDHAIMLDDVLVQAGALVNGASITRESDVPESFRYYHVELATHELLLAENCPAESFVDNIDRMHFHNWDERDAPTSPVPEMEAARAKSARQVPMNVRTAIAARLGQHAVSNAA